MVLFATDIAARGLDFPTVDWVVQVGGRGWPWPAAAGGGGAAASSAIQRAQAASLSPALLRPPLCDLCCGQLASFEILRILLPAGPGVVQ
jgi:hypothetical protein